MPKSETEVVHPHLRHRQTLPRHVHHEVVLPQAAVVVEDLEDPADPEDQPDPGEVQVQAGQAAGLCHIPDPLPDLAIGMNV
jgi:hypothetical protein